MIALHVKTENDANGNPRRGFLILHDPTGVIDFVVEGYLGEGAVRHAGYRETPIVGHIKVQPGEYRRLRTVHGDSRDRDH